MPFDGTTPDLERAAVLRRAADLLEERGWCRFQLERRDGHLCAMGALLTARGLRARLYSVDSFEARVAEADAAAVADALGLARPHVRHYPSWSAVATWNNNEAADGAEVAAGLRRAADALEDA